MPRSSMPGGPDPSDLRLNPEIEERLRLRAEERWKARQQEKETDERLVKQVSWGLKGLAMIGPVFNIVAGAVVIAGTGGLAPLIAGLGTMAYSAYNAARILDLDLFKGNVRSTIIDSEFNSPLKKAIHILGGLAIAGTGVGLFGVGLAASGTLATIAACGVGVVMGLRGARLALATGVLAGVQYGLERASKKAQSDESVYTRSPSYTPEVAESPRKTMGLDAIREKLAAFRTASAATDAKGADPAPQRDRSGPDLKL